MSGNLGNFCSNCTDIHTQTHKTQKKNEAQLRDLMFQLNVNGLNVVKLNFHTHQHTLYEALAACHSYNVTVVIYLSLSTGR